VRAIDKLTAAAKEKQRSTGICRKLVTYVHDQLWLAAIKSLQKDGLVVLYQMILKLAV